MSYEKVTQLQSRIIIGTKQTLKAMNNGEVSEVFIAKDADQHITDKVLEEAKKLQIPHVLVDSKKKLGLACKIDVDASTVAIKHE
ncbi:ribosomal L7Ae/L30e/S12e/Gadd45 family protein [Pseudogracilibacillus auburnensis]|uniref:LSU ribosomal protein L7AE n=1 Tax=Pseudogracilibacillus auburnensis TaxID=1494959 RepID=A0A2V3W835_9BACI|nr:ribosomal L7Ae/L30e/S12e/Gadd45 family protein [Pseudogracilibacillus auburnensis]MBO1005175.1 ribosomal L7Ae/L30e/S12e/Gadd45 family protein [Pseudogracilibacillus auburnensis]PXW84889.1 LSU ribosomal protein L7AE [Pseudogracilibacillus auburnensis]